jgi:hypothetical protein
MHITNNNNNNNRLTSIITLTVHTSIGKTHLFNESPIFNLI